MRCGYGWAAECDAAGRAESGHARSSSRARRADRPVHAQPPGCRQPLSTPLFCTRPLPWAETPVAADGVASLLSTPASPLHNGAPRPSNRSRRQGGVLQVPGGHRPPNTEPHPRRRGPGARRAAGRRAADADGRRGGGGAAARGRAARGRRPPAAAAVTPAPGDRRAAAPRAAPTPSRRARGAAAERTALLNPNAPKSPGPCQAQGPLFECDTSCYGNPACPLLQPLFL